MGMRLDALELSYSWWYSFFSLSRVTRARLNSFDFAHLEFSRLLHPPFAPFVFAFLALLSRFGSGFGLRHNR